jgi:hypothetical protein
MLPVRLKNPILSHCGINHSAIEEEPFKKDEKNETA